VIIYIYIYIYVCVCVLNEDVEGKIICTRGFLACTNGIPCKTATWQLLITDRYKFIRHLVSL
jgi:hypothetical protein